MYNPGRVRRGRTNAERAPMDASAPGQDVPEQSLQSLVGWAASLPVWAQDALRLLYLHDSLTEEHVDELTAICQFARNAIEGPLEREAEPVSADHVPAAAQPGHPVSLIRVGEPAGVNALASDEHLAFRRSGLTIVYGPNASGKSGYARVLKSACRARHRGDILPNVYETAPSAPPTATVRFESGGQSHQAQWIDGEACSPALSRISVFDSACAEIYVDSSNELAFTPKPLRILEQLADAARKVRARVQVPLARARAAYPTSLAALQNRCHSDGQVARLLRSIGPSTPLEDVTHLARLTREETDRAEVLRGLLAADLKTSIAAVRVRIRNLESLAALVSTTVARLSDDSLADIAAQVDDWRLKQQAANLAASQQFTDEPLPAVGSEVWQTMWEAARHYSDREALVGKTFPVTDDGSRCVLCQQTLLPEAMQRLKRFERFVADATQSELDAAVDRLRKSRDLVAELTLTAHDRRQFVEQVDSASNGTIDRGLVRRYLIATRKRHRAVEQANTRLDTSNLPSVPHALQQQLTAALQSAQSELRDLEAAQNDDERAALKAELTALRERTWLNEVLPDVSTAIDLSARIGAYENCEADTDTTAISRRATQLAESLVTGAIRDRFAAEIDALGLAHLRVEMLREPTAYGAARFRIRLIRAKHAPVAGVLSEGEHRCLAIAAFLAELTTANDLSGIIFDDPVSSLDHNHRELVATRLAKEAQRRQVVVFTHDLYFLVALNEAARREGVEVGFQSIARGEDHSGRCSSDAPVYARNVPQAVDSVISYVGQVQVHYVQGRSADWAFAAKAAAGTLRDQWERAAELAVQPALSRFSNSVRPSKVRMLTVLDANLAAEIAAEYSRCSEWAHSAGAAANRPPPKPDDLLGAARTLKNWVQEVQRRQADLE